MKIVQKDKEKILPFFCYCTNPEKSYEHVFLLAVSYIKIEIMHIKFWFKIFTMFNL